MTKLKELLNNGKGHTIFKTDYVIEGLKEFGFKVTKNKNALQIEKNNNKSVIFLTLKPTKPPKSKYDVASWEGDSLDGIHDLDLIKGFCGWVLKTKNKQMINMPYIGRGYQYRAYRDWLKKENVL